MSVQFKTGDRVKCINKNANSTSILVIGKIYKVLESENNWIRVEGISYDRWTDTQFEKIEEDWDE